ncbi:hypothetical protein ABZX83_09190 [Streptomyces thermoviolaceus]|uniref:hypothetical protein n=1 Tax=Streptomyces thermoviolaceus TaxID=1952 RepID=UPI0033A623B8
MLAQLPLPWLLLMAAFATSLATWGAHALFRLYKVTATVAALSIVTCLGFIAEGRIQPQHWNARQMLVLYSFAWTGITIGLFPSRKVYFKWVDDWNKGIRRDRYKLPRRYQAAFVLSFTTMVLLAFLLST